MDQNQQVTQSVDNLFCNLEEFTRNEGLFGKPFTHGDKTLIPVVSVTLGYGTGNSQSKAQAGSGGTTQGQGQTGAQGTGMGMGMGALGLGARISTDAVVVIDSTKDHIMMLPVGEKTGNMQQLIDKIPQMVQGMGKNGQQSQQQSQGQGQNQGQPKQ